MSTHDAQPDETTQMAERMKPERWQELLQAEAAGEIADGMSIVAIHNEFCAMIDGKLAEHRQFEAEAASRKADLMSQIDDAVIDCHLKKMK